MGIKTGKRRKNEERKRNACLKTADVKHRFVFKRIYMRQVMPHAKKTSAYDVAHTAGGSDAQFVWQTDRPRPDDAHAVAVGCTPVGVDDRWLRAADGFVRLSSIA